MMGASRLGALCARSKTKSRGLPPTTRCRFSSRKSSASSSASITRWRRSERGSVSHELPWIRRRSADPGRRGRRRGARARRRRAVTAVDDAGAGARQPRPRRGVGRRRRPSRRRMHLEYLDGDPPDVGAAVAALLPAAFCQKHGVAPLGVTGNVLRIAVTNPMDYSVLQDAEFRTGKKGRRRRRHPDLAREVLPQAVPRARAGGELRHARRREAGGRGRVEHRRRVRPGRSCVARQGHPAAADREARQPGSERRREGRRERRPHRAARGVAAGPAAGRRAAARRADHPAPSPGRDHLASQDHVRAWTSPSAASRRTAAAGCGSRAAHRSPRLDDADAVRREDRHPAAEHRQGDPADRPARAVARQPAADPVVPVERAGDDSGDRADRQRQDLDAVHRAELDQVVDQQHHHARGSDRDADPRREPDADQRHARA